MENKAKYTTVGLFLITFFIAMVLFILWLARYDVKELNAKEFRVYSKNSIAGLHENSIVEYKGLDIGTVNTIHIDPKNLEQIEIILRITKPNVIKTDSYAIIQSQGVTGNKIIEIDGGSNEAKPLEVKEGSYSIIPLKKSFLDKLTSSAGNISSKIENTLMRFEKFLSDKNLKNIETLLTNVNNSSKNFDEMIIELKKIVNTSINNTFEKMDDISTDINKLMKKDVKESINNINNMSSNMNILTNDVRKIVNNDISQLLNDLKTTVKSSQDIDIILYKLDITLEKIDSTLENFNENGGNMIFKTKAITYAPGEKNEK